MIRSFLQRTLVPAALLFAASGCRGSVSDQPPIHIIPDMDYQPKYLQQGESLFFSDHRANRDPPEGTIARGELKEDTAYFQGRVGDQFVSKIPLDVNEKLVRRERWFFSGGSGRLTVTSEAVRPASCWATAIFPTKAS